MSPLHALRSQNDKPHCRVCDGLRVSAKLRASWLAVEIATAGSPRRALRASGAPLSRPARAPTLSRLCCQRCQRWLEGSSASVYFVSPRSGLRRLLPREPTRSTWRPRSEPVRPSPCDAAVHVRCRPGLIAEAADPAQVWLFQDSALRTGVWPDSQRPSSYTFVLGDDRPIDWKVSFAAGARFQAGVIGTAGDGVFMGTLCVRAARRC